MFKPIKTLKKLRIRCIVLNINNEFWNPNLIWNEEWHKNVKIEIATRVSSDPPSIKKYVSQYFPNSVVNVQEIDMGYFVIDWTNCVFDRETVQEAIKHNGWHSIEKCHLA